MSSFYATFESEVVALLLHRPDLTKKLIRCIKPQYFSKEIYSRLAAIVVQHSDLRKGLTKKAIIHELVATGLFSESYVSTIVNAINPPEEDEQFLVDKIVSFARRAELRQAIVESIEIWKTGTEEQQNLIVQKIEAAASIGADLNIQSVNFFDDLDELFDFKIEQPRFKVLLPKVDEALGGGLRGKRLLTVAGRAKLGKSMFLTHMAVAAALQGRSVYFGGWELSNREIRWRIAQRIMHVPKAQLLQPAQKEALREWGEKIKAQIYVAEWQESVHSMRDVERDLDALYARDNYAPDVLVLDYGSIMGGNIEHSSSHARAAQPYLDMRAVSKARDIPVITAAQINREGFRSAELTRDRCVPRMHHLGDAIKIVQVTDYMLWLGATDEMLEENQLAGRITSRTGASTHSNIYFDINFATGYIRETANERCGVCREVPFDKCQNFNCPRKQQS